MRATPKFESGGVWVRQYHDKDEVFTINAILPSREPGHNPMAVTFADGTNMIFSNYHNTRSLKTAKKLGYECVECKKIMFGAKKAGECEGCEFTPCDANFCSNTYPRREMTEGKQNGNKVFYCPECVQGTKDDNKADERDNI